MPELGAVADTLFIPMLGRIYASEYCKSILTDEKALSIKDKLPKNQLERGRQTQYYLIASAARSANMDRTIRDFLARKPDGVIVQLGCGLETTFYRNDNGRTRWYEVDLPNVIAYRRTLLPEQKREIYLAGDAFDDGWFKRVRTDVPDAPLLVTASGLFHYFQEDQVLSLLRMLSQYGNIEVVFDAVSQKGLAMMQKKYMKEMGHSEAQMFFSVDRAARLAEQIGPHAFVLAAKPYYLNIDKSGLKFFTKISMIVSDHFHMVKMIHLKFERA